ncbi:MAG: radical SAM protein [bacterium]
MKSNSVFVTETFTSIQGESTWSGLPCFFVRLSGCNLRCRYCDSIHSYPQGKKTSMGALARQFAASSAAIAEITGGEPLAQPGFRALALALHGAGKGRPVLVETNGSMDVSAIPEGVIAVMDIKSPDSGEAASMDMGNLNRLRAYDEVKLVISSRRDFVWARRLVEKHDLARRCHAVLFSPVQERVSASMLAAWVLEAGLPVRLQVQLHKVLGVP